MLTIYTDNAGRDCSGASRREFISAGMLGLGGLTLGGLLSTKARAAALGDPHYVKDKAVVLLFLSGGPSHIETFDPHMDAPSEIRSVTGEVRTSLPGVTFGGTFERLSKWADRMAIVRSFAHPVGSHEQAIHHVLTAGHPDGISMGAMYTRLRGANNARTGIPTYNLLTSDEVDGQYSKERTRVQRGSVAAGLGAMYGPFEPGGKGPAVSNMQLRVPADRLADRRTLRASLDQLRRQVDASGQMDAMDRFEQQAIDLVLHGAGDAYEVDKEDPRVLKAYDTSHIPIGKKRFRPSNLGHQMLMARRLVEAGAGFVTVHSAGWDMHADGNNPGMLAGMKMLGTTLDIAVSAFLEDLRVRGLSEKVLLVVTGDFGRTPKINKKGGRDHWANLCTLALAGGGLKTGQVIGRSARDASTPDSDPVSPQMLMSTIMHTLLDLGEVRVTGGVPREVLVPLETSAPIPGIL